MNTITSIVHVSLTELIDNNLESFLDLLEELVLADYEEEERYSYVLEDISYRVADYNPLYNGLIPIEVVANLVEI